MAVGDPIKIKDLPAEGAPALTRQFPETDGATTRRMTIQQIKTLFELGMSFTGVVNAGAAFRPTTNDGAALGDTTHNWSDSFYATGHVTNYNNGNYTVTQSSGLLTYSGAMTVLGAFTSLGIDDNATGERWEIADTVTKLGSAVSASGYNVARAINDGFLSIDGGNTGNAGANMLLIGGTHASLAFDISLQHGTTPVYYWDDSAGTHTLSNSAGTGIAVVSATAMTLAADLRTGGLTVGSTPGSGNNLSGACLTNNVLFTSAGGNSNMNRTTDGVVLTITSGGVTQGVVTIAGATVTWGTFTGSHLSQLLGGASPIAILRGSIVDTIDELCQWFAFTYTDLDGIEHTNENDPYPDGLKVGDTFEYTYERDEIVTVDHVETVREVETTEIDEPYQDYEIVNGSAVVIKRHRKKRIAVYDEFPVVDSKGEPVIEDALMFDDLGNQLFDSVPARKGGKRTKQVPRTERKQAMIRVARSIEVERKTQTQERQTVAHKATATIVELRNDTLARFEVSETEGSERPYGVFGWWCRDYGENDNDANIVSLGTYVVRVGAKEKIAGGDLIESAGDGTGRVMRDDALSAIKVKKRHVATITAAVPIAIHPFGPMHYPDGSRLFPATIQCG